MSAAAAKTTGMATRSSRALRPLALASLLVAAALVCAPATVHAAQLARLEAADPACPGVSGSPVAPELHVGVGNVQSVWQDEPPVGDAPAPAYPVMIAADVCAAVHAATPSAFPQDVWGETRTIRLSDLSSEAAPDALTWWALRGQATPVYAELLNDAGVNFHVANVDAFGTAAKFGQGATPDPYVWAGAAAGAPAHEGNQNEALEVFGGVPVEFPDAPQPATPVEGHLEWQQAGTLRSVTSRAWNPRTNDFYSTTLVANVAYPSLRVVGGDLTQPATSDAFSLDLPADARPLGSIAIFPTGLPGVDVSLQQRFPDVAKLDFHRMTVSVAADPHQPWPQSRSSGAVDEWEYRPLIAHYGDRKVNGLGVTSAVSFDAPLPAGYEAVLRSVDGSVRRIAARHDAAMLHVLNVGGRQVVRVEEPGTVAPAATQARATRSGAQTASTGGSAESDQSVRVGSPEVRGLLPADVVSAAIVNRDGVSVLSDVRAGATAFGDTAVPYLTVDGTAIKLDAAALSAPPLVLPQSFGDGKGEKGFYGAGIWVKLFARTHGVMAELDWNPITTSLWSKQDLYVFDVHSIDGAPHRVDVEWYSRPPADGFEASELFSGKSAAVPVEAASHVDYAFFEDLPDVRAVDSVTSKRIDYFLLAPSTALGQVREGPENIVALVADHDAFSANPLIEVNGEALSGRVALYSVQHFEGFDDTALGPLGFRALLTLRPA